MSLNAKMFLFEVMIWFVFTMANIILLFATISILYLMLTVLFAWFAPTLFMAMFMLVCCAAILAYPFTWAGNQITRLVIAFINRS